MINLFLKSTILYNSKNKIVYFYNKFYKKKENKREKIKCFNVKYKQKIKKKKTQTEK